MRHTSRLRITTITQRRHCPTNRFLVKIIGRTRNKADKNAQEMTGRSSVHASLLDIHERKPISFQKWPWSIGVVTKDDGSHEEALVLGTTAFRAGLWRFPSWKHRPPSRSFFTTLQNEWNWYKGTGKLDSGDGDIRKTKRPTKTYWRRRLLLTFRNWSMKPALIYWLYWLLPKTTEVAHLCSRNYWGRTNKITSVNKQHRPSETETATSYWTQTVSSQGLHHLIVQSNDISQQPFA